MSHYETEYSGTNGFHEKREVNDERIRKAYIPYLLDAGFNVSPLSMDSVPMGLSATNSPHWIDPLSMNRGIRPPDLKSEGNKFFNIRGTDCRSMHFEIKDYPQENNRQLTGAQYLHLRVYVAAQHMSESPVGMIFMDNFRQEQGTQSLSPYVSAFKNDNGEFVPYGGLLFDLKVDSNGSYRPQDGNKPQVRWKTQSAAVNSFRIMKTLDTIADDLKSGRIEKVIGDPSELDLWIMLKTKADHLGHPPLQIPKGGLVYYRTNDALDL